MKIDIERLPYSRRGSYLCILHRKGNQHLPEGLYLRSIHGTARPTELLQLEPIKNGKVLPYTTEADVRSVRLVTKSGTIELCMADVDLLRFRGKGIGLRLSRNQDSWGECAMPAPGGRWELNSHMQRMKCMFHPLKGILAARFEYSNPGMKDFKVEYTPDRNGVVEGAVEEFHHGWGGREITTTFDADARALEQEFAAWLAAAPPVPASLRGQFSDARERAAYLNWSSLVRPMGSMKREGMYMSKVGMTSVWSWDNCFNALATAHQDHELAWSQFMIPFDNQDADGCLPDVTTDNFLLWAFNKPPIQGWFLRQFAAIPGMLTAARMAECYEPMCRWTNWWFRCRDYDGDGVVQCNHGNDGGWDNATVFDLGLPVESPDLTAFLVIQCEMLAEMGRRLGHPKKSVDMWDQLGKKSLERLLNHSRRGDQFVSPRSGDHGLPEGSDSLLNYIPIVLGMRLPDDLRRAMVGALGDKTRFCAPYGPPSEALSSPRYKEDGYWRGPVWAPSTMLIVEGLRQSGAKELADDLSLRFCRACAKSGFAENFDARTGVGLCDSAYTWTSSVFLHMMALACGQKRGAKKPVPRRTNRSKK